jgi:hypothetical protein
VVAGGERGGREFMYALPCETARIRGEEDLGTEPEVKSLCSWEG